MFCYEQFAIRLTAVGVWESLTNYSGALLPFIRLLPGVSRVDEPYCSGPLFDVFKPA